MNDYEIYSRILEKLEDIKSEVSILDMYVGTFWEDTKNQNSDDRNQVLNSILIRAKSINKYSKELEEFTTKCLN